MAEIPSDCWQCPNPDCLTEVSRNLLVCPGCQERQPDRDGLNVLIAPPGQQPIHMTAPGGQKSDVQGNYGNQSYMLTQRQPQQPDQGHHTRSEEQHHTEILQRTEQQQGEARQRFQHGPHQCEKLSLIHI